MSNKCLGAAAMALLLVIVGCQQVEPDHEIVYRWTPRPLYAPPPPSSTAPVPAPPPQAEPKPQPHTIQPRYQPPVYQPPHTPYAVAPRSWYPTAAPRSWHWIVIHHSDTQIGSAAAFDRFHREVHHWDSLGYDFVIGNGHGSADGLVEVGPRWTHQSVGAHAGVREYNETGIGICLVGDFQTGRPSSAQLHSLARLSAFLMRTYHIPPSHIIGHHDFRQTNCPGRNLSLATVRTMSQHVAMGEIGGLLDSPLAQVMPRWELGE